MPDAIPSLDEECFYIAPIGKEDSPERKRSDGVLKFIVAHAAQELGLTAVRADQIGEPGQITIQVIDHILGAKAAVADLTDLNPNVFYELAVRHTARLPVALIAEKGCKLPFDIAQMRTIFFDHTDLSSADQCRREIVIQLHEALNGAVDSPITTSVDVRNLQAGSAVERNVAELVTTVQQVAVMQRQGNRNIQGITARIFDLIEREQRPISGIRAALRALSHMRSLVIKREDQELHSALVQLEDSIEYLARRFELRIPLDARRPTWPLPPPRTEAQISSDEVEAEADRNEAIPEVVGD